MSKTKEKDPAFLLYSKDWLEGTAELLPAEKGVYIDLLCHQHQKGDLPADTLRLSRIAGLSHEEFMQIWPGISDKFEPNGNRLVNRKLTEVMTERSERGRKNTIIGTFASLLRTGNFTDAQRHFLKKSFKADAFLTESDRSVTERLTEWLQQRLKSIEDEDANEDEDENENSFGKFENLFFGNIPEDLIELAGQLKPTEKADEWHDYVQGKIERLGYQTRREVPCKFPDGRDGRIDLVAERDGIQVAIELDYRTPRKKSVLKVQTYPRGMVLLRDPLIIRKDHIQFTDEWFAEIFDDLTIEQIQMTYTEHDVLDQLAKFKNKVRLSPETYKHRDTGGIRMAFDHQLRNTKPTKRRLSTFHTEQLDQFKNLKI